MASKSSFENVLMNPSLILVDKEGSEVASSPRPV